MNGHFHSLTNNHRTTFNYSDTSVQSAYIRVKPKVSFVGQKIEKSVLKLRQSLFKPYNGQGRVCNRVRDKKCFELEIHEKFDEIIHR